VSSNITGLLEAGIPMMHYVCVAVEKLSFVHVHLCIINLDTIKEREKSDERF